MTDIVSPSLPRGGQRLAGLGGIDTSRFIGYQNLRPSRVPGGTIYVYDQRVRG